MESYSDPRGDKEVQTEIGEDKRWDLIRGDQGFKWQGRRGKSGPFASLTDEASRPSHGGSEQSSCKDDDTRLGKNMTGGAHLTMRASSVRARLTRRRKAKRVRPN